MNPAILIPTTSRSIRAAIEGAPFDTSPIEELDAHLFSEADVQSTWVAIARRPELACVHAQAVARGIVDDPKIKTRQWMLDVLRYRGQWLDGGIVAVTWNAAGDYLSRTAAKRRVGLGYLPASLDTPHLLDYGLTWRVEFKQPGKIGKRGSRINIGKVTGAQLAMIHALNDAGHPSMGASSVMDVALGFVRIISSNRHRV